MNDRVENPGSSTDSGLFNFDFLDDISNHVDSTIDSTLGDLETKVSEAFDPAKVDLANVLEQIPILSYLMADFIANLKADGLNTTAMSAPEVSTRFNEYVSAAGVELTPTQLNIFNWTNESISFWNQNLPAGIPSMPPSVMGIHFGIFQHESSFNPEAVSGRQYTNPDAARGLAQFKPGTWRGYVERHGDLLVQNGIVTEQELNDPEAITANPRLHVFMTTAYILKSYAKLQSEGLLEGGWDDPELEYKLYLLHHYGSGDGPKHIRYHATTDEAERQRILSSMRHPHLVRESLIAHDRRTAQSMREWQARFQQGNNSDNSSQVA